MIMAANLGALGGAKFKAAGGVKLVPACVKGAGDRAVGVLVGPCAPGV